MFFDHRFKEKPQGKECGWVQKSIKETEISIEDLAVALANGATFKPSVLVNGNKAENWYCQQLFGLDFDDGTEIEEAYGKAVELGITEDNKTSQFPNEAELYQFINSIDLHEYLGVPDGMFCCILPNHDDNAPSANIYTTDDGTQIYKCFGCNQSRTIISITEQLAHCKRSEAINFIKKVYKNDYKPSEWVEKQRQLMIDSALYLNSEEFKETFPQINKLIRTRKADIQNILMHMTKHISNGLQYDGKPLFFVSLTSLMKKQGN